MINFQERIVLLKRINMNIKNLSWEDFCECYRRVTLTNGGDHASMWPLWLFDLDLFALTSSTGCTLASTVSVEYRPLPGLFKCVMRFGEISLSIVYDYRNLIAVDQIYITINRDRPQYKVHTLGRHFKLDQDKHPEFFLTEEEISYAMLLGQEPMLHVSEFIEQSQGIFNFCATLVGPIQPKAGEVGKKTLYRNLTRSTAIVNISNS